MAAPDLKLLENPQLAKVASFRKYSILPDSVGLWPGVVGSGGLQREVITTNPRDLLANASRDQYAQITPQATLPAVISASQPVQFRINPGACSIVQDMFVDWTYTEGSGGGGASVTPIAFPFVFQRIELGAQNSTSPVQIIYPEHLYARYSMSEPAPLAAEGYKNLLNMQVGQSAWPPTFGGESAIPSAASRTFSLPWPLFLTGYAPPFIG